MEEDRVIIEKVKNGDIEAFALLVEKYQKRLLNFIYRRVGDEKIVEDIGQEVFLDVYKSLENFDEGRGVPFSAWLFISARNRCISELRKRNGPVMVAMEEASEIEADARTVESALIEHENRIAFRSCIEKLSEPFKRPLLMSLQGSSFEEIANRCEISLGTAKSRIHRAKEKLKTFVRVFQKERI